MAKSTALINPVKFKDGLMVDFSQGMVQFLYVVRGAAKSLQRTRKKLLGQTLVMMEGGMKSQRVVMPNEGDKDTTTIMEAQAARGID